MCDNIIFLNLLIYDLIKRFYYYYWIDKKSDILWLMLLLELFSDAFFFNKNIYLKQNYLNNKHKRSRIWPKWNFIQLKCVVKMCTEKKWSEFSHSHLKHYNNYNENEHSVVDST